MPYLSINNYAVPIAAGAPRMAVEEIGGRAIALDGTELADIRADKREWQAQTIPLVYEVGHPLTRLILGRGHSWDFESAAQFTYSGKGLGPTSSSGATRVTAAPHFGVANLQLAATTGSFVTDPQFGTDWTVMVWRNTGAGYQHYLETSGGLYMLDGVVAASEAWLSVSAGVVTLANTTGSAVDFDDMVLLPYVVDATMGAAFGTSTAAFGVLPKLACAGDFVGGGSVVAIGSDPRHVTKQGAKAGVWKNNLLEVTFRLREDS